MAVIGAQITNFTFSANDRRAMVGSMILIPVNSSAIAAIGFEADVLGVVFRSSGKLYLHPGVLVWVYLEFMAATSKGGHYARFIKGKYR